MDNIFKKTESIRKTVEAYKTDSILGIRDAATIYKYSHQSIYNRFTKKNQSAPNTFISAKDLISRRKRARRTLYTKFQNGFFNNNSIF
jgi:hypothetical protein